MRTFARAGLGLFLAMVPIPALAVTPSHLWSRSTPGTVVECVAADRLGNTYLAGSFSGTADFGAGFITGGGAFVAKYDPEGSCQWSLNFPGAIATGIAVDDYFHDVVVTGDFTGTVDFGSGPLVSAGLSDVFVAKFSATGIPRWSRRYGGADVDVGESIAVDNIAFNVAVTGFFTGTVDFGNGDLAGAGGPDAFVLDLDIDGQPLWSRAFGTAGRDFGFGVAVDGGANVVVTGWTGGPVDFGGGTLAGTGAFLAKYDAASLHQWSKLFGGGQGASVAVDGGGNIVLTGGFSGTVDFGGGGLVSSGSPSAYLAKFDGNGVHQWSHGFGDGAPNWQEGTGVAVDPAGNILLTGFYQGIVDLGGGPLPSTDLRHLFLAKYGPNGACQWSQGFGTEGFASGFGEHGGIAADAAGNIAIGGIFNGPLNLGGGTLGTTESNQGYLAKLGPNPAEPLVTSIKDIRNDEGREVRVTFTRSGLDDAAALNPVFDYVVYRRIDPLPNLVATATHRAALGGSVASAPAASGYDEVGSTQAFGDGEYSLVIPTLADSTIAHGMYRTTFFVRAATGIPTIYHDSPIDSGYSVDNLSPEAPANLAYGADALSWSESAALDFDHFTVYGSNASAFGSATVVDETADISLDVSASPYAFYFVTATDASGNEGSPATVGGTLGTHQAPEVYVLSVSAYPNPFNPVATVRYTVPSAGHVRVGVYATGGALVRTLVDSEKPAGAYAAVWDGRNARGEVASSGVYFAHVTHPTGTKSYKMVLSK